MPVRPTDERSAMIEAYEAQYGPCDRVEETALFFAWAARGEYERARAERLLDVNLKKLDVLAAIARAIGADANTLESALRRFVPAARAEPAPDGGQG